MNLFKTFLLRATMALMLACGATSAIAGQIHYVSVDTSTLAGRSGYLDFLFLSLEGAAPAAARVSQLAGRFGGPGAGPDLLLGDASGSAAAGLVLGNGESWNEAGLWTRFGGILRFAVDLEIAAAPDTGTTLAVALLDAQMNYLGAAGDVVRFALQPGHEVDIYVDRAFATVSLEPAPVPEPASMALLAAGMLALAARARRRG